MIKPSGTVAHEQMATNVKMWFKKLLSGFIISLIIFVLALVVTHSICESKLSNMYIPEMVNLKKGSFLMTFEGAGIIKDFSKFKTIDSKNSVVSSGYFLLVTRKNADYETYVKKSKKIPKSSVGKCFGFFSMMGSFFGDLFFAENSNSDNQPDKKVSIIGNKKIDLNLSNLLFQGNKIVVEPELRQFFNLESVSKKQYISTLDKVFNGNIIYYRNLFNSFIGYSFLIFPGFILLWFFALRKISFEKTRDKFIRGAVLMPLDAFLRKLKSSELKRKENLIIDKSGEESELIEKLFRLKCLKIGELEIPRVYETTHILLLGTTGSGKSVLLNQLLKQINERGDKCIIYDPKGEFYSKHGRPEDLIFYPFDERSVQYSILNEVSDLPDFHVLANSLIQPERAGENEYFYRGAQEIFAAALIYLFQHNLKSIRDILNFINLSIDEEAYAIRSLPREFQSALAFLNKDDRSSHGVKGTLMSQVSFLRHMMDMKGDFSFRKYVKNNDDKRNLFIMNKANFAGVFKPLMTFVIDTMILECLSMPDVTDDRRIFLIMDEFDSLGKMPAFLNGQKQLRSKGVSIICATQDLGGFETTYGKADMRSFFNNFNTNWIFRVNDPETSKFLSEAFGEQEIKKLNESRSMSPSDYGDRQTLSEQDKIEKILLPAQFQNLKNFQSYFKIANVGITKFNVPEIFYDIKKPDFILNKKAFSIDDKLNGMGFEEDVEECHESEKNIENDIKSEKPPIEDKSQSKLKSNFNKLVVEIKDKGMTLTDMGIEIEKEETTANKKTVKKNNDKIDMG